MNSSAFTHLGEMGRKYAGDGENLSPPLEWTGAPQNTREFALVCYDPDAPLPRGFTHWVVYGIPADATRLSEGQRPDAFTAGVNGTGKPGYLGPMPPKGHGPHHYYFWVYALDSPLKLKPGLNLQQLLDAIDGHVLEQARIVGVYQNR